MALLELVEKKTDDDLLREKLAYCHAWRAFTDYPDRIRPLCRQPRI